ncbi:hypothetical protein DCS_04312 [Drechmeria coniospora]|uniref:Uncharacterized protein n=1 Tax=Drechmeria coniospora TaxID=98403 RepID=A0A151GJM4_DRECN|nr:hypothetical protein DCS_04312 [Drechmeria coniospora]KYK57304.1 hypothetical protein DCS_04312 [Drechmeria coniospora]ODA79948.1 hypothetical protein RJ55_05545 [Drechmeria coniospora]
MSSGKGTRLRGIGGGWECCLNPRRSVQLYANAAAEPTSKHVNVKINTAVVGKLSSPRAVYASTVLVPAARERIPIDLHAAPRCIVCAEEKRKNKTAERHPALWPVGMNL